MSQKTKKTCNDNQAEEGSTPKMQRCMQDTNLFSMTNHSSLNRTVICPEMTNSTRITSAPRIRLLMMSRTNISPISKKKILVYQAISTRGRSKALIFKSGLAINQFVYRDKCLKKSLIPFLRKYHSHDRYVFWPDLASVHYARTVQDYLTILYLSFSFFFVLII